MTIPTTRHARTIRENIAADDQLIHGCDTYCRCRSCKPPYAPMPGEQRMEATRRLEIALVIGLAVCGFAGWVQFGGVL